MCGGGGGGDGGGGGAGAGVNANLASELSPEDQARVRDSANARAAGVPYTEDSGLNSTDFFGGNYNVRTAIDPNIPSFSAGDRSAIVPGSGGEFDSSNYSPGVNFGNVMSFNSSDAGFGGGGDTGAGGGTSQPITNLASAASSGAGGFESVGGAGNLNSFAPGGGINIPSDYPDLTSNASTTGTADGAPNNLPPFSSSNTVVQSGFDTSNDATRSGVFDQSPTNYTSPNAVPVQPGFSPSNLGGAAPGGGQSIADLASSAQPGLPSGGPADSGTDPYATPPSSQVASSATPGQTAPPSKPTDDRSALEKLAAGAMSSVAKNPLGIIAAGAGLGLNLARGNQDPKGLAEMKDAAASLKSTGSVLQSYLQTGTLPPGMQASVDQATSAAKARIISNYASRGLNTDPTKNSALQQELQQLQQNAIITAAQIGDKLMERGLSATQISASLYKSLVDIDQKRQQQTGAAISNFASALSGGGSGGTTIKFGGGSANA